MNIFVSGGLGYIGSHTVVELIKSGHSVIIADNLYNSSEYIVEKIFKITGVKPLFYNMDICDEKAVRSIFLNNEVDVIFHFAGYKAVGESIINPIKYYDNNIKTTITLAKMCVEFPVKKFVFSSSATVYGARNSPMKESMRLMESTNPYGETKKICEKILTDLSKMKSTLTVNILRYFNPVGAHKSYLIGENPNGIPNNLMPYIAKVGTGELKILSIYGDDYDTPDGTAIRDYIHVVDLAKGHVFSLNNKQQGVNIFNLGTGKGISVQQMVDAFKEVNNIHIPYKIVKRREGDVPIVYADVSKAKKILGWSAELTIEDMVRDSWNYERKNKIGDKLY